MDLKDTKEKLFFFFSFSFFFVSSFFFFSFFPCFSFPFFFFFFSVLLFALVSTLLSPLNLYVFGRSQDGKKAKGY